MILPYRDRRAIKKWCMNNGVRILSDIGSKLLFVFRDEFEKAINRMNSSYNKNQEPVETCSNRKMSSVINKRDNYKPQGTIESSFLSILQNLTPTL